MKLKELRKSKKLTQTDLANSLYMTQNCYSSYECGRTEPNIETLCKIADFYNVSLDYLVGRDFRSEVGFLSNEQKNVVYVMKQLNDKNLNELLSIALKMLDEQK